MTFQAYLDNILAKTGKTPEDFRQAAGPAGLLGPGVKAGPLVAWLKADHGLGHGHAMAIFAVFKQRGWIEPDARAAKAPGARAPRRPATKDGP